MRSSTGLAIAESSKHSQDHVLEAVRPLVTDVQFPMTKARISAFRGAYGTVCEVIQGRVPSRTLLILLRQVLFFEDCDEVEDLVHKMPQFAKNFPQWTEHTAGLHHYAVWTALDAAGLGCSLQHYNPLIDADVQRTWNAPKGWVLKSQLVFGSIIDAPREKTFKPLDGRYWSFGL
jgi:predicted oxidoreductase (fatty acid repression mutant protein)